MGFTYQMPSFRFHIYVEAYSLQISIATNPKTLIFLEGKTRCQIVMGLFFFIYYGLNSREKITFSSQIIGKVTPTGLMQLLKQVTMIFFHADNTSA